MIVRSLPCSSCVNSSRLPSCESDSWYPAGATIFVTPPCTSTTFPVASINAMATGGLNPVIAGGTTFFFSGSSSSRFFCLNSGNSSAAIFAQPFKIPICACVTTVRNEYLVSAVPSVHASRDNRTVTSPPVPASFARYVHAVPESSAEISPGSSVIGGYPARSNRSAPFIPIRTLHCGSTPDATSKIGKCFDCGAAGAGAA